MAISEIDIIKKHAKDLTKKQKLELIDFLWRGLKPAAGSTTQLEFGKYASSKDRQSTEDDFRIAEWNPTDLQLNGN